MVKKGVFITYCLILVLLGMILVSFYFLGVSYTGFAIYQQGNQSEFDLGTYDNTEWNGSSIVLSSGQTSGSYTSKVFDSGNNAGANWNNLTHQSTTPEIEYLYGVDGGGDVYYSTNLGSSWSLKKEDYGRTTDTQEMFSDSDYLYILSNSNREVWRSGDNGDSWSVVNDTIADSGVLVGEKDSSENLYAADASGDVYISTDLGVTWTLQGDFNGGATNNARGMGIDSSGNIYVLDGSKAVYHSSNQGVNWTQKTADYGGGGTSSDDLEVDSSGNLYILDNKDVWRSSNGGENWTKINDSFTDYSNDGCKMLIDENDNFFIADCVGRVFSSNDGITWTEEGDLNEGAGNDIKGLTEFIQSTNLSFQVRNCSQLDCSDGSWQTSDLDNINLQSRYFQYMINFSSPDTSSTPFLEYVTIDYSVLNSVPIISIVNPQQGMTYGYNESIALNFIVSDGDGNLDSCWYNINNQTNNSLVGCINTTFDVSGDGTYTLNIYANDTEGESANDITSFDIQIGAPTITLNYPIDIYLNSNNVTFNYSASDIDLDSCELWGDFTGTFKLNQTDTSPNNGSEDTFTLNLGDGAYIWNILCNDTQNNQAINGNKTFYVDTLNPIINLVEPVGTKNSKTNIPLTFSINETNIDSCWYNISYDSGGGTWVIYPGKESVILSNCSSTTFDVVDDYSYWLFLTANDSSGNINLENITFTVDTNGGSSGGGGGGGGGGGSSTTTKKPVISGINKLEMGNVQGLIMKAGEIKKATLKVRNSGTNFLNDCKIKGSGGYSSWISYVGTKNLAAGEEYDFIFNANIPEDIEPGSYTVGLTLECTETSKNTDMSIEITEDKIGFELIKVERYDEDQVKVIYYLEELSNIDQEVELQFLLFDVNNEKLAEIKDNREIASGSKEEFEIFIPVDQSLEGELSLLVNLNSETYSSFVQEDVILGSSITGLAVFDDIGGPDKVISGVLIFLFLGFAIFMIRRILKHKKKIKTTKKKHMLWLE